MVIFHSYVSLPEGIWDEGGILGQHELGLEMFDILWHVCFFLSFILGFQAMS